MWIKYDNRAKGDGSVQDGGGRGLILRVGDGGGRSHSPRGHELHIVSVGVCATGKVTYEMCVICRQVNPAKYMKVFFFTFIVIKMCSAFISAAYT